MNPLSYYFPVATVVIATATETSHLVSTAEKYGLPGLMLLALGAFAVWQEKQRRNEAKLDRAERGEERALYQSVLDQKSTENKEMRDFIMSQVKDQ